MAVGEHVGVITFPEREPEEEATAWLRKE